MIIPVLILWSIWEARNACKYRHLRMLATHIVTKVWNYVYLLGTSQQFTMQQWCQVDHVASFFRVSFIRPPTPRTITVFWRKPEPNWLKLNTDGASKHTLKVAGAGGIARDHHGNAIFAFAEYLGNATNTYAEIFAIYEGLRLAEEKGYSHIWLEVDAKAVLDIIGGNGITHWSIHHLVMHIRRLIPKMHLRITHIYREGNIAADFLANLACETKTKVKDISKKPQVERELMLVKINRNPKCQAEVMWLVDIFRAKIVDISDESLTIEVIGDPGKMVAVQKNFGKFGIREIAWTGKIAVRREKMGESAPFWWFSAASYLDLEARPVNII